MAMTFLLYSTLLSSGNRVSYENFCVYYQTVLISFSHPIHLARSTGTGVSTTLNSHSSLSSMYLGSCIVTLLYSLSFFFLSGMSSNMHENLAVLEGDPLLT